VSRTSAIRSKRSKPGRTGSTRGWRRSARVKKPQDALYLRDTQVAARELADAEPVRKYGLLRTLDNTGQIASTLASCVHFKRSYGTLNR
jgi:zinc protease